MEAGSGEVLGSVSSLNAVPVITDQGTGPVTLPSTGTYISRVANDSDRDGTGAYEFMISD